MSQRKTAPHSRIWIDQDGKNNVYYIGVYVEQTDVVEYVPKSTLEARDELIKEMVSDLSIIKTQLNLRLDKHSSTSTEDGIYLIISNLLTKAQSFNQE